MTLEIAIVLVIIVLALVVFALELTSVDFVAFGLMALLLGLSAAKVLSLSLEDAISGFSNTATITVLAMFILSGGVYRSGAIHHLGGRVIKLAGSGELQQLIVIMLVIGPISMFINNTAAVAILIPLAMRLAHEKKRAPSKLLIPLSFTSQFAGVVTLIGTSTNILASSLTEKIGVGSLGMFEFAKIGLLIAATGAIYLLLVGRHLLPGRRPDAEITDRYKLGGFLTEVVIPEQSPFVGKTLAASRLREDFHLDILEIVRGTDELAYPLARQVLQAGDILFARGDSEQLLRLRDVPGITIEPDSRLAKSARGGKVGLIEVVIAPNSSLIGETLASAGFAERYGCTMLAIRRRGAWALRRVGELVRGRLHGMRLGFGDSLLLQGERAALDRIKVDPNFIVTEEVKTEAFRTEKIPLAIGIVTGVVVVAALGIQPILVAAVEGCVLMVLTGCLTTKELHESIRWDVILLLAGVIPLGIAFEKSGGAELLAGLAAKSADYVPAICVLWIFYFFSMLLTELISNNATVVLLVPVAASTAMTLGLDPKAVVFCVMFAASTSFSTPVGYQTNTMVYGPGGYRFLDFTRVGAPLNLLLWIVTPLYIAWVWGVR